MYQRHPPNIEEVLNALPGQATFDASGDVHVFYKDAVKLVLLPALAELPPGHCDEVLEAFQPKLESVIRAAIVACKQGPSTARDPFLSNVDVLKVSKSLKEVIDLAEKAFPAASNTWAALSGELANLHDASLKSQVLAEALQVAASVKDGKDLTSNPTLLESVEKVVDDIATKYDKPVDAFRGHEEVASNLARKVLDACMLVDANSSNRL